MKKLTTFLLLGALSATIAAACGDDNDSPPTADGPTTLSVEKAFARDGNGNFTFTLEVTNAGDNAAVLFVLSDVWEDGLEVTTLGDFGDTRVEAIGDRGFEALRDEFAPGESVDIDYTARCVESGQWTNVATVTADNAEPVSRSVSVSCP